jgi:alkylhydroperoxidase/carboxymuconolactone decarboxylase family protein YurZ
VLNLAMISGLNRQHELKMHVKGALKNGVTLPFRRRGRFGYLLPVGCYTRSASAVRAARRQSASPRKGKSVGIDTHR